MSGSGANKKAFMSILLIVCAASLWGMLGLFTRPLCDAGFEPIQITQVRSIVAVVALLIIILLYDRSLLRIRLKDIWMFLGAGVLGLVMFNTFYFKALDTLSMSMACVLLYTAPCFVVLMAALLFHDRLTSRKVAALLMAFCGCICISGIMSGTGSLSGIVLGLQSGFCLALYMIFSKLALNKYHPLTVTFYTFAVAAVCLLPSSDIGGIVTMAGEGSNLVIILALGLLLTVAPYFMFASGLKGLDPGKASIISFIEPMVATVAGFVHYGESPDIISILGIMLILASIVLLAPLASKEASEEGIPDG